MCDQLNIPQAELLDTQSVAALLDFQFIFSKLNLVWAALEVITSFD
jgi:hypothetical protein